MGKPNAKQSMQNTNRQSMIQSILEESDGYDDDIMDNFNKQYEQEKKDQRDSNKRAYAAKMGH